MTITGGKISAYDFNGCASIGHITVPNDITCIGNCAFADCSALTDFTIPGGHVNKGFIYMSGYRVFINGLKAGFIYKQMRRFHGLQAWLHIKL